MLIELVDEEPPPPPEKPKKPIEQILDLVEDTVLTPGKWVRCAMFGSPRAAKGMATKLTARTEGEPYEWQASDDDRLFVRVEAAE